MTYFVAIHSAFHGGWLWDRLGERLRARGHRLVAPTLAGVEGGRGIPLGAHVGETLRVLAQLPADDTVLIGHSYGGMVAGVAARRAEKGVKALIAIDAALPRRHASMMDILPDRSRADYRARQHETSGVPAIRPAPGHIAELSRKGDAAMVANRLRPQPLGAFIEPADFGSQDESKSRYQFFYFNCATHSHSAGASLYRHFGALAAADGNCAYRELPLGAYGMLDQPLSLADAIIQATEGAKGGLSPWRLRRVMDAIDQSDATAPIADLAAIAALSPWHFARAFQRSVGLAPHRFMMTRKLARACRLLTETDIASGEIGAICGFGSESRFAAVFRQRFGCAPGAYRRNAARALRAQP